MTTLSIELQRLNAEMILQRLPRDETLRVADLTRLESARRQAVHLAKEGLNATNEWRENLQLNQEISNRPPENHTTEESQLNRQTSRKPPLYQEVTLVREEDKSVFEQREMSSQKSSWNPQRLSNTTCTQQAGG